MGFVGRILLISVTVVTLVSPASAARSRKSSASLDTLKQYVNELSKSPSSVELREKIIKYVHGMRHRPSLPEEAERHFVRGTAYFQKARDLEGYKKAIFEFQAATNTAPWLALAYFNLGVAQEAAGRYAEALQSFKLYLLADPNAKNAREVKNKIYALEVDVEDILASRKEQQTAAAAKSAPATTADKKLAIAGAPTLEIESPEKSLNILKMPAAEKQARIPSFIGKWYFKESLRGEDLTIEAFEIGKNASGDLVITPPKRAADSYATVTKFEINDKNLVLQMRWKMRSVIGYWKTETYKLSISDDGKKLTGNHNQRSVGGRNIDMDRVLFRQ